MKTANVAIFVPHGGCPHQCGFCNQKGISGAERLPTSDEVAETLTTARQSLGQRTRGASIAFFGGSFTAIPQGEMLRLLRAAQPFLGEGGFGGIRISTRPDAVDAEVLDILGQYGVTAIELGAQSMDDRVLAACGRGHTVGHVVAAAERIRAFGFALGLQMMTGLPLSDDDADIATARAVAALRPDTVRIYPTLVLEHTPFAELWRSGGYAPQALEQAVDLCAGLLELFEAEGIPVIRLGLHDSPTLKRDYLAGPYHPAFRELCEGAVLLRRALTCLAAVPPGEVRLTVSTGAASKMAGQNGRNRAVLEGCGYRVRIAESPDIPYLHVNIS